MLCRNRAIFGQIGASQECFLGMSSSLIAIQSKSQPGWLAGTLQSVAVERTLTASKARIGTDTTTDEQCRRGGARSLALTSSPILQSRGVNPPILSRKTVH